MSQRPPVEGIVKGTVKGTVKGIPSPTSLNLSRCCNTYAVKSYLGTHWPSIRCGKCKKITAIIDPTNLLRCVWLEGRELYGPEEFKS